MCDMRAVGDNESGIWEVEINLHMPRCQDYAFGALVSNLGYQLTFNNTTSSAIGENELQFRFVGINLIKVLVHQILFLYPLPLFQLIFTTPLIIITNHAFLLNLFPVHFWVDYKGFEE